MSDGFLVMPDMEAVASVTIRGAHITNLRGVFSSIPARNANYPLATVKRTGGIPAVRRKLDEARIQVDVWGGASGDGPGAPSKSKIHDIAQQARVALLELEGTTVIDPVDAFITGTADAMGMSWSPDPSTGRDRYLFAVILWGYALQSA